MTHRPDPFESSSSSKRPPTPAEYDIPRTAPSSFDLGLPVVQDREARATDYADIFRRHSLMIALVVAAITLPVTVLMMMRPDYYDAKVRLEIGSPISAVAKDGSAPTNPADSNTQLQYLSSPALMRGVIQKLELERDAAYLRHVTKSGRFLRRLVRLTSFGKKETDYQGTPLTRQLAPSTNEAELAEAKRLTPYVDDLTARVTALPVMETRSVVKETRLVEVTVRHPNPLVAAKIANAVADLFVISDSEVKTKARTRTNESLLQRAAELKTHIYADQQRLTRVADSQGLVAVAPGQDIASERLAALSKQLLDAENERKVAESNYKSALAPDAARAMAEENTRAFLNEATMKLADLRGKRAHLLVGATEEWPEVKEIDQQIRSLERDMANIRSAAVTSALTALQTRFRQAEARESYLRKTFTTQRELVQSHNRAAGEGRNIQEQIDANKALLTQVQKQLGDIEVTTTPQNGYRVIEYSIVPDLNEPAGPWRLAYIGGAFFASVLIAGMAAIARESFDQKLRSTDDVEAMLQVMPIALIRDGSASVDKDLTQEPAVQLYGSNAPWQSSELLTSGISTSAFVEDYRRLRTALLMSAGLPPPKTILVTSSTRREGATTTAVNVAISIAETGARVLLIDANFSAPALDNIFRLDNEFGLSSLLSVDNPDIDPLDFTVPDVSTRISVLPAGPASIATSELLGSQRMRLLLNKLGSSFTHIVVDAPPISSSADSLILSSSMDAVLLVVHAAKTPRALVRHCRYLLESIGPTARIVLNNIAGKPQLPIPVIRVRIRARTLNVKIRPETPVASDGHQDA